ncbi:MAG: hypothetical protein WCG27_07590, partial [Pseudomonadota bacterium]
YVQDRPNEKLRAQPFSNSVQIPSLTKMRDNGYISEEEFQTHLKNPIEHPERLIFSQIITVMPYRQAKAIFAGDFPWERVVSQNKDFLKWMEEKSDGHDFARRARLMEQFFTGHDNEPIEIIRSSAYILLRQIWNPQLRKMMPIELPLQKNTKFKDLVSFEPLKYFIVQVGRALSEKGKLKGNFVHALQALLPIVQAQAENAQVPPARVLIVNHAGDRPHIKMYESGFGMRILTPDLSARISNLSDPEEVDGLLEMIPPSASSGLPEEAILIGTLKKVQGILDKNPGISWIDQQLTKAWISSAPDHLKPPPGLGRRFIQEYMGRATGYLDFRFHNTPSATQGTLQMINLDRGYFATVAAHWPYAYGNWRPEVLSELLAGIMAAKHGHFIQPGEKTTLLLPLDCIKNTEPSKILIQGIGEEIINGGDESRFADLVIGVTDYLTELGSRVRPMAPELSFPVPEIGELSFNTRPENENVRRFKNLTTQSHIPDLPTIAFMTADLKVVGDFQKLGAIASPAISVSVLTALMEKELEAAAQKAFDAAMNEMQQAGKNFEANPAAINEIFQSLFQRQWSRVAKEVEHTLISTLENGVKIADATALHFTPDALQALRLQRSGQSNLTVDQNGAHLCATLFWAGIP